MATIPPTDLVLLVRAAGFPNEARAVAVILGESGGDPAIVGVNSDGTRDRGLWQFNERWHPDVTDAIAFDPEASTRVAFTKSNGGTDFSIWNATKSPNFPGHLATAGVAVARVNGFVDVDNPWYRDIPLVGGAVGGVVDVAGNVIAGPAAVIGQLGRLLGYLTSGDFWRRVGYVVIGSAAIITALVLIFRDDAGDAVRTVVSARTGTPIPDEDS